MMPPIPFTLAAFVLIGYPLIQIGSIFLRRKKRAWFVSAIAYEQYHSETEQERAQFDVINSYSKGDRDTFWRFARLPWLMFITCLREGPAHIPQTYSHLGYSEENTKEERLLFIREKATELEMLTHPITLTVTVPIAVIAWTIGALAYKARHPWRFRLPVMSDLVRTLAPTHELTC